MFGLVGGQLNDAVARIERRHVEARHHAAIIDKASYTRPDARMFFRGQKIGKYKILSALGSGGFGTVYLAEDTWIDKKVALKVPHRQSANFGELLKEPRLLASLSHPNVVTVLTAEKQDNVFFIVMEYVTGETLENIIGREGALEMTRALDFTCQICNALDHAHRQNVLHRDLRPANIMIADNGLVKVADFGTSRILEAAAIGTTVIGSPPYMAPEQFHGRATFASDIYSLGVTMYQMMTGTLPYQTPAPADLERLMRGELVSPPRLRNGRIPQRVNDIILKAMAPEIAERYQRAADLLEDLLGVDRVAAPRRTPDRPAVTPRVEQGQAMPARPRENPQPRFCWKCHKPLHARTDRCHFCGEAQ
jgi:eukaryotic-like serine/threonine-protein kinase